MTRMLDLSVLSGDQGNRVLSGKDRGIQARKDFNLDELDKASDDLSVLLSSDLDAITPSFVLGMFGASVKAFGSVDAFFHKYHFEVKPHLIAQIRRGAEYSLLKGDPLPF